MMSDSTNEGLQDSKAFSERVCCNVLNVFAFNADDALCRCVCSAQKIDQSRLALYIEASDQ